MNFDMLLFVLLALMVLSALWAVLATDILKSAIALALASVFLSIVIFLLGSPLAAVFELSVCAGLITVVFVSAISMVKPQGNTRQEDMINRKQRRLKKYLVLPILLAAAGVLMWLNRFDLPVLSVGDNSAAKSVAEVMWNLRRVDLVGQMLMILVGALGIVVLFKEFAKRGGK